MNHNKQDKVKLIGDVNYDQPSDKIPKNKVQHTDRLSILPSLLISRREGICAPPVIVTDDYTVNGSEFYIRCNASGGAFTVTLPDLSPNLVQTIMIGESDGTNIVSVDDSTGTIAQLLGNTSGYKRRVFIWDGLSWDVIQ